MEIDKLKYGNNERDPESGLDYAHARYYSSTLGIFPTPDPHWWRYPHLSSYNYCGNNPIMRTDPTGMIIDPASQEEWDNQKNTITAQRDKLIENNKKGKYNSRIESLNQTLANMTTAETSETIYNVANVGGTEGELTYDVASEHVVINFTGTTGNFVHEITHVGQFERSEIGFNLITGNIVANDLWDEATAYRAEYHYKPFYGISNVNDITPNWVSNIVNSKTGNKDYGQGGDFNTGQRQLNVNSSSLMLRLAYPNAYWKQIFDTLPIGTTYRDHPAAYLFK